MTSTGQNRPENAFKEVDSSRVKTLLACILKKLYLGKGLFRSGPRREVRSVNKAYLFATPGGEPLWRVSDDLAIFVLALHPAKKMLQRAAPETRPALRIYPRLFDSFTPSRLGHEKRWDVRGSRPFSRVSVASAI